jgi:imidazolonepropionase-like amidohydrolase
MLRAASMFLVALPLLGVAAPAPAQPPREPGSAAPARPVVLRAARLFDGKSDTLLSPAIVVVQNGSIAAAGPRAAIPDGAQVIDLGDATLLPGLIDAHVHLAQERTDDFQKDELDRLRKSIAEQTLDAAEHARKALQAGFTTLRALGTPHQIDAGLRNAIARGAAVGPRIVAALDAIGATGGHCDSPPYREGLLAEERAAGIADGPEALRAQVRRHHKYGADVIKVCVTGGVLSLTDDVDTAQLTQAEMDAIVDEAHALRRKVAVHAHGPTGAKRAIRAGADSIEHGTFLDDEAFAMMRARGTLLVPTPLNDRYYDEQIARGARIHPRVREKMAIAKAARRDSLKRALAQRVRIAFGTDAGVYPHGRNAEQLGILVEWGMRPIDALRSATSVAAGLLGLEGKIGTLEPGKLADVIAVPGDALRDVRATERVFFVMKEGAVVRDDRASHSPTGRASR